MIISKYNFKLLIFWFIVVALISINISYFINSNTLKNDYLSQVESLKTQENNEINALQKEIAFYTIQNDTKSVVPSAEDKKKIDFINSGYNIDIATGKTKSDCSQIEKPWRKITNSSNCSFVLKNAAGNLKILIIEFAAPDLDITNSDIQSNIEHYNKNDESDPSTYSYLKTYFEREAKKFNTNFTLTVDKSSLIKLDSAPEMLGQTRAEQLTENNKFAAFFLDELAKAKIDITDYDGVIITIFYNKKRFPSFAIQNLRANVNDININAWWGSEYNIGIVAHETAHLFGAQDQYIEGSYGCQDGTFDEYVSEDKVSLMCRVSSLADIKYGNPVYGYPVINKRAAKEMGWINE